MNTDLGEDSLIWRALLHCTSNLVKILSTGQLVVAMGVQQAKVAVQLAPVIPSQLFSNTVQCDV